MNTGTNSHPVNNSIPKLVNLAKLAAKKKKEDEVGPLVAAEHAAAEIASNKVIRSLTNALKSGSVYEIPQMMRATSEEPRFGGSGVDKHEVYPMGGKKVRPFTDDIVGHVLATPEMKIILLEKEKATLKAELEEAKKNLKKKHEHLLELQSVIVQKLQKGSQIVFNLNKKWQGGRKTRRKKTNKRKKKRKSKKRKRRKTTN